MILRSIRSTLPLFFIFALLLTYIQYPVQATQGLNSVKNPYAGIRRIAIKNKDGGLVQISFELNRTFLEIKRLIEPHVGIPPQYQLLSTRGLTRNHDYPDDTIMGDIPELEMLSKVAHIVVRDKRHVDNNTWDVASYEEPLRDFIFDLDEPDMPPVLNKMKITQLHDIGFHHEKEFVEAGLKIIPTRKFLQHYFEYIRSYLLTLNPRDLDIEPFDDPLKHFLKANQHCPELITVLKKKNITHLQDIGFFRERDFFEEDLSARAPQALIEYYCDTQKQVNRFYFDM